VNKSDLKRLDALEQRITPPPQSKDAELMRKLDAWFLSICGRTVEDLSDEELERLERLFRSCPDQPPSDAALLACLDHAAADTEPLPLLPDSLRVG